MDAEMKLNDFKVTLFLRLWELHMEIETKGRPKYYGSQYAELKRLVQELGLVDEAMEFVKKDFTQEELNKLKLNEWKIVH